MPRKVTIEDLKRRAEELGGKCLSTEYKGAKVMHTWQGPSGRVFELQWTFVKSGQRWDKIPRNEYTIIDLKNEAIKRGKKRWILGLDDKA